MCATTGWGSDQSPHIFRDIGDGATVFRTLGPKRPEKAVIPEAQKR